VIKLLHLVSTLDYSGAARTVTTLATELPRHTFEVRVTALGDDAPWAESLREAGVLVDVLGWRRAVDVRPILSLRRVLQAYQPQVIHAWSAQALRILALIGRGPATRLVVSHLLRPGHLLGLVDRILSRRADWVVAFSGAEAEHYRANRVAVEKVVTVQPGVRAFAKADSGTSEYPLPTGRILLCIGPLEMHKGFRDAIWALDILHFLYEDLHLVLAGNGSDRSRLATFAQTVGASPRVHFLGHVDQVAPLLRRAAVVWVPTHNQGGTYAALEAMAAGRAVVATRTGGLDEIVVDGITGFLIKPGDKAGLARVTRLLLDDRALAARLGEAGRQRVCEPFTAARMAQQCERLYAGTIHPDPRNPPVPS
jgi:glycosyltransferase involved in cell wall biosynthesis